MVRYAELEQFRLRLWDRYISLRTFYKGNDFSFDLFWFDFLLKQLALEEIPTELVYDEVCETMEKHTLLGKRP